MCLLDHWRFRAEEMRTIADKMEDPKTKLIMVGVAEDYERITKLFGKRDSETANIAPLFSRRSQITRIVGPLLFVLRVTAH